MTSMAERRLRRLDEADAATLEALETTQPPALRSRQLLAALNDPATLVLGVESEGVLVGHAVVARLPFDAELQALLVAPDWRRRGVAVLMLDAVIDQAHAWGSERLLLEVREGNAPARALYARAGFVEDGRRCAYYPPLEGTSQREDALLLSLPLG